MAIDTSAPRTRRALLAGVGGALAALAAQALGRPLAVRADDENIKVGGEYPTAKSRTYLRNETNDANVFETRSTGSGTAVSGASDSGTGISGDSVSGPGVWGSSDSGPGVWGSSFSGRAVVAASTNGLGLDVSHGRARFGQVSGVATIRAGTTSKTVSPGVDIVAGTFALLTPKGNVGSRSLWYTTSPAAETFTIHIGSALSRRLRVAWLLLG